MTEAFPKKRVTDLVSPRCPPTLRPGTSSPTQTHSLLQSCMRREPPLDLLVVGASTGGPQALVALFGALAPSLAGFRTCVSLHMPSELMPIVARHIAERCGVMVEVARTDSLFAKGVIYFSQNDVPFHFERSASEIRIVPRPLPGNRLCGPTVDKLFAAAAGSFGSGTLGVVLSGMGKDGLAGAKAIVSAGGEVLVQDKNSSAVWGMPGSVAKAGLASAILSPLDLGHEIARRAARLRHSP